MQSEKSFCFSPCSLCAALSDFVGVIRLCKVMCDFNSAYIIITGMAAPSSSSEKSDEK